MVIQGILDNLGVEYETQKAIGPWSCDFFIPSFNLAIEADGEYWHSLPHAIEKDGRKNKWFEESEYSILRLPGDKIRERPEWCQEQIIKHLR